MNRIITIGREFGSGGRELGRRLSEKLGIAYYDKEIITEISKRTQLSEEYVHQVSEKRPLISFPIHVGQSLLVTPDPVFQQNMSVLSEQYKLLTELAEKSDCIIVGRCADYMLREMNPFRIFVYADTESKLKRCMERSEPGEHLTEKELRKKMKDVDRSRAQYCEFCSQQKWGDKSYYDLLINTSGKNIKQLSNSLYEYLK